MAAKKKNFTLERICTPVRKETYAEAEEHRQKILEKGELMGNPVAECKIRRRGRPRGGPEHFDVIPYKKVKVVPEETAPEDPTLIAGRGAVS